MKKALQLAIVLSLAGCTCTEYLRPEPEVVKNEDKYFNCYGLSHAISETQAHLAESYQRCNNSFIFTDNPLCGNSVKIEAIRSQYNMQQRLKYLYHLCEIKRCKIPNITSSQIDLKNNGKKQSGKEIYVREYYIPATK